MTIRLDRATFKRLVQLYIVSAIISTAWIIYSYVGTGWSAFSQDYDTLVERHFGDVSHPDWLLWSVSGVVLISALWMFASMFGLLRFKRWARTGVWASIVIVLMASAVMFGWQPNYSTPLDDVLALLDSVLLGSILLLAYAEGYGANWFGKPLD